MRARLLALIFGLLVFGAAGAPPPANAATYTVWSCADQQGKPLSVGDFSPSTVGSQTSATTTCDVNATGSTAGSLQAVTGAGPSQADASINAAWNVAAAPGTKITGLSVWWTNRAGVQAPGRVQIFVGNASVYSRDAGSFGVVTTPFDDAANLQSFTGLSGDGAGLVAWCLSSCARPDRAIAALFNAYRVKLTVSDTTPPTGEASGTTDGMTLAGPVTLTARASDVGGGVRDLQLLVDGAVVDARQAGGSCTDLDPTTGDANDYTLMHPCLAQLPAATESPASFALTPAMLHSAGPHTIEVMAHDAAGNASTLLSQTVLVAPVLLDGAAPPSGYDAARDIFFNPDANAGAAGQPNGINAGPANVSLAFVLKNARRVKGHLRRITTFTRKRTVSYSAAARMRARLKTPAGLPIIGARVYRALSVAGGPWRLIAKPLVTSKTGSVSILLPARSPSRRVALIYFPSTDSNTSSRSKARLLAVRAPLSLSVSRRLVPRGGRVNITARVRAGMRPGATVLGALQLYQRGRWHTIRQLHFTPRSKGVARTALRLRTPAAYPLRLRVSAQAGLRYTTGVSTARTFRVR